MNGIDAIRFEEGISIDNIKVQVLKETIDDELFQIMLIIDQIIISYLQV